jgi:CubicO group peptidase (beta-lactamase class C family)
MSKYRWRSAAIAILVCPLLSAQDRTATAGNAHPFAKVFQPFLDDHSMAGAVFLVADRTKVLDEETIGYADLATKRPMRTNQEFWIASMSKSFAGTALMMLVDEGKVKIDDPVEKYLPEFRNLMVQTPSGLVAANHPILVREILSHPASID